MKLGSRLWTSQSHRGICNDLGSISQSATLGTSPKPESSRDAVGLVDDVYVLARLSSSFFVEKYY